MIAKTASSCAVAMPRALTILAAASAMLCAQAYGAEPALSAKAVPIVAAAAAAAPAVPSPGAAVKSPAMVEPQNPSYTGPTEVAPALRLTLGKSALIRLPADATRLSIGNPEVADVMMINPREVYLLGKAFGSTNLFVWSRSGHTTLMDVSVGVDTATLRTRLSELVPTETAITVDSLADSVVLSGRVKDPMKVQRLVSLAEVYGGSKNVVNLLMVEGSQQIMLEVKVAEVSRALMDQLGVEFNAVRTAGSTSFTLLSNLLVGAPSALTAATGRTLISLDAQVKNGLVKILAEPTIMAMSGQEGSFLAGGKIYIPVPQGGAYGASTITLEEKEFGVGLRFTPTLLEGGRINLRVTPEVSEVSQVGTSITSLQGQVTILPTITTRRASTTVQLRDGESFAIGGLIKSNVTEALKAIPGLGEVPVLGALFRSTDFRTERSELLFIVTPRLVKPLPPNYAMPTDSYVEPSRVEVMLGGRLEGAPPPKESAPPPAAAPAAAPAPAPAPVPQSSTQGGGFQLK